MRSLFVLLLAFAAPLAAQTFRGDIRGTVQDPSGAVLPDAKVTAVNKATNFSRTTLSSAAGEFSLPDLPTGIYSLAAVKEGFQEEKSDAEVVVSRVATVNFHLNLTMQASSVSVSASVSSIETSSTTITGVVNTQTVEDLPMNGRDFRQMLKLSPGVQPATTSINGGRTRGNNFMIDGADNNDAFQGLSLIHI